MAALGVYDTRSIDLQLPRSWNECSTEQLELITRVMLEQIAREDRYHPFSMENVKIALFFALSGIQIVEGPNLQNPTEEQYYTCRFLKDGKRGETFPVYLWQINYWITPKANTDDRHSAEYMAQGAGIFDWLDNERGMYLTRFPYPTMKRRRSWWRMKRVFQGALPDLDGFSWAQYRFATDTMGSYTQIYNNLLKMQKMGTFSDEQLMQQAESVDMARSMFLATVFNAKTKFVDTNTGMVKYDFHYESTQCTDNAPYFRHFPDYQWQVVLFWWTGIMHTLSRRFPHVFKVQKIDPRKQPSTPLEIYTATTATMQKYASLTEDQVNNQSYSLVLEHLERLSKENEEMEKIRKK